VVADNDYFCRDLIEREENAYNLRPEYLKKFKPVEVKVRKIVFRLHKRESVKRFIYAF